MASATPGESTESLNASVTVLPHLLTEYGRPFVAYEGTGELEGEFGVAPISFAAAQYPDGQVLLACQSSIDYGAFLFSTPRRFTGLSTSKNELLATGQFTDLSLLTRLSHTEPGAWAVFRLSALYATVPSSGGGPPREVRFLLTNYEFDIGAADAKTTLRLPGIESDVFLEPLGRDSFAEPRLRSLRDAHPTGFLGLNPILSSTDNRNVADRVCCLLSVARGTKVQWIQEQLLNSAAECIHVSHVNRITKRFSNLAPIDSKRALASRSFVEGCYAAASANWHKFKLGAGTVDAVLDAKAEGDYLEIRGAKLAVALELMKHNVLAAIEPEAEFIIPADTFQPLLGDLAAHLKSFLTARKIDAEKAGAVSSASRLPQLNRRSFSYLLRRVAKQIDLKLDRAELALVVQCRNSLVHRGDYYCVTATQDERAKNLPKPTRMAEYLFLVGFLDQFLLRLVDYRGPYAVRKPDGDWEIRNL